MTSATDPVTEPQDPVRRRLLQAGASLLGLPLLAACSGGEGARNPSPLTPLPPPPPPPPPPATLPPRGLHASFTGDPVTTRTLTWFTDGEDAPESFIEYGPVMPGMSAEEIAAEPLPHRAPASREATYGVAALTHRATAGAIDPALPLRYRVGSSEGWSAVQVMPPLSSGPWRFAHFGDHAMSDASRAVIAGVLQRRPDFTIIAGDLSYANGEQAVWDRYFDMLQPLASTMPVLTCPGNHEAKDGGGEGYRSRVAQPGSGLHYGFDYGRVHFYFSTGGSLLSDASSGAALAEELVTIERDLASAAARRAAGLIDFIVFVQHYTIWTDNEGRDPANPSLVLLEEHILVRYGVDLLLVGHDHIYERSKPMAYGRPLPTGYVQVTQGGGGQALYALVSAFAEWSEIAVLRHGFTEFEVDGPVLRGITFAVDDERNQLLPPGQLAVIDRFELVARSAAERAAFALPARKSEVLLADFDAVLLHTLRRNRHHDAIEHGLVTLDT